MSQGQLCRADVAFQAAHCARAFVVGKAALRRAAISGARTCKTETEIGSNSSDSIPSGGGNRRAYQWRSLLPSIIPVALMIMDGPYCSTGPVVEVPVEPASGTGATFPVLLVPRITQIHAAWEVQLGVRELVTNIHLNSRELDCCCKSGRREDQAAWRSAPAVPTGSSLQVLAAAPAAAAT